MSRVQSFLGCLGFRVFGVRVGFRLGGVKGLEFGIEVRVQGCLVLRVLGVSRA